LISFESSRAEILPADNLIKIPRPTLVVLCGASGSGKTSFAARNFLPTSIVSTDALRGMICDDETNQESSFAAFDLLFRLVEARLRFSRTTVIDSTALDTKVRRKFLQLAAKYDYGALLIMFDTPLRSCIERDAARGRSVGAGVIKKQYRQFEHVKKHAYREGFDQIVTLNEHESAAYKVEIGALPVEKPDERGPFDLIGDIHGCYDELVQLLTKLGYEGHGDSFRHPGGRKVVFLGDLVNRGPDSVGVVRVVASMVQSGAALYVRGNHCQYILAHFRRDVGKAPDRRREWLESLSPTAYADFGKTVERLVGNAPPYLILNGGKLVAVHAGIESTMIGKISPRIGSFCLYGEDEVQPDGSTKRRDWAASYRGAPLVAYGHTPTKELEPKFRNNTVNLDQGCVYGGRLSALRYPEMEFVQIDAARTYKVR
jgi:predicted kinase/diadenosine tetraphosphatase ApaH/serine/threonine PP2A family protein phosphatase